MAATTNNLVIDVDTPGADVIFKALGHPPRLKILKYLESRAHTVSQISENFNTPVTTLNQHLKVLEEAKLIQTDLRPASRGTEKVCSSLYQKLICNLNSNLEHLDQAVEIRMPVGAYSDFEIIRPCGIASKSKFIGLIGDPDAFLEPEHIEAQILWFGSGYVEYRFPKRLPHNARPTHLSITMEICSEAVGVNSDFPSDITLWINSVDIGTWRSPGDFGDRKGMLNPDWWKLSQYGHLKTWQVDAKGCFVDGVKVAQTTISDLKILEHPYVLLRIGNKPGAEKPGGVNLFGAEMGDYPTDILMRIEYT